jgi:hypothetical protein
MSSIKNYREMAENIMVKYQLKDSPQTRFLFESCIARYQQEDLLALSRQSGSDQIDGDDDCLEGDHADEDDFDGSSESHLEATVCVVRSLTLPDTLVSTDEGSEINKESLIEWIVQEKFDDCIVYDEEMIIGVQSDELNCPVKDYGSVMNSLRQFSVILSKYTLRSPPFYEFNSYREFTLKRFISNAVLVGRSDIVSVIVGRRALIVNFVDESSVRVDYSIEFLLLLKSYWHAMNTNIDWVLADYVHEIRVNEKLDWRFLYETFFNKELTVDLEGDFPQLYGDVKWSGGHSWIISTVCDIGEKTLRAIHLMSKCKYGYEHVFSERAIYLNLALKGYIDLYNEFCKPLDMKISDFLYSMIGLDVVSTCSGVSVIVQRPPVKNWMYAVQWTSSKQFDEFWHELVENCEIVSIADGSCCIIREGFCSFQELCRSSVSLPFLHLSAEDYEHKYDVGVQIQMRALVDSYEQFAECLDMVRSADLMTGTVSDIQWNSIVSKLSDCYGSLPQNVYPYRKAQGHIIASKRPLVSYEQFQVLALLYNIQARLHQDEETGVGLACVQAEMADQVYIIILEGSNMEVELESLKHELLLRMGVIEE